MEFIHLPNFTDGQNSSNHDSSPLEAFNRSEMSDKEISPKSKHLLLKVSIPQQSSSKKHGEADLIHDELDEGVKQHAKDESLLIRSQSENDESKHLHKNNLFLNNGY